MSSAGLTTCFLSCAEGGLHLPVLRGLRVKSLTRSMGPKLGGRLEADTRLAPGTGTAELGATLDERRVGSDSAPWMATEDSLLAREAFVELE